MRKHWNHQHPIESPFDFPQLNCLTHSVVSVQFRFFSAITQNSVDLSQ